MGASTVTFRVTRAKDADVSAVTAGTPSECLVWDTGLGKLVRKSLAGFALAASLAAYAQLAGAAFTGDVTVGTAHPNGKNVTVNHPDEGGITLNNTFQGGTTTLRARSGNKAFLTGTGGLIVYALENPSTGKATTLDTGGWTFTEPIKGGNASLTLNNSVGALLDWNTGTARLALDSLGATFSVGGSTRLVVGTAAATFSVPVVASGSNYFSAGGSYVGWNGGSPSNDLRAGANNAVALKVRAFSVSQAENLQEWDGVRADSTLNRVSSVSRDGSWSLAEGLMPVSARLFVEPKTTSHYGVVVRGKSGQGAALLELQDYLGASIASLSATAATFSVPVTASTSLHVSHPAGTIGWSDGSGAMFRRDNTTGEVYFTGQPVAGADWGIRLGHASPKFYVRSSASVDLLTVTSSAATFSVPVVPSGTRDLGTTSSRWSTLYGGTGNFSVRVIAGSVGGSADGPIQSRADANGIAWHADGGVAGEYLRLVYGGVTRGFVLTGGTLPLTFQCANGITLDGPLRHTGTALASTLGSVTRRMPIYDGSGTLLGYIPIYNSIS